MASRNGHRCLSANNPQPGNPGFPWPKDERKRMSRPRNILDEADEAVANSPACKNRLILDQWNAYDTLFYNAWLDVPIEPTKFVCPDTLHTLDMLPEVMNFTISMSLSTLRVYYANPLIPFAQTGHITWMMNGFRQILPPYCRLHDIC